MAQRGGAGTTITNVAPQMRLLSQQQGQIRGVDSRNWPSALQPVAQLGGPEAKPLGFPFQMGQNLIYTPRADSEYKASDLKSLARYPLARICIENVKDIICGFERQVHLVPLAPDEPKAERDKRAAGDPVLLGLNRFWDYPDGEHAWDDWLRPLLEDLLVIDAASILVQNNLLNKPLQLRVIPGDTITRYIDDQGFTPLAPSIAYAQLWNGVPRVNMVAAGTGPNVSQDGKVLPQLIYRPRNIVPRNTTASFIYGMSQTEQLAEEIDIGIQRLLFVKAYYKDGVTGGLLQMISSNAPPDKVKEYMDFVNSDLLSTLAKRRGLRPLQSFGPPEKPDTIIQTEQPVLADVWDDMHIKKICYGYGASAQRLMKMMNRASAQTNQEAAEEEGTIPVLRWLQNSVINFIIQRVMNLPQYEMVFDTEQENDVTKQSAADKIYVDNGTKRRNEVRVALGMDPDPNPLADQLCVTTPQGAIPLGQAPPQPAGADDNGPSDKVKKKALQLIPRNSY